ncbi:MAG: hypothetical protein FXV80_04750 [Candidatus Thioglobus sp.]|nr:MAG: hypothetical protein FXV80_04750 [Candidatus Thioglobus sp.]
MKKILAIIAVLLLIMAIAATYLLDTFGKQYAQGYAQKLLKTPVRIGQINSSFFDKSLNIDFIEVQNLPNFNNKNILSLDHFSARVGKFDDDLIVVDTLIFDGMSFFLEQNNSSINLTSLLSNLEQKTTSNNSNSIEGSNQRIKIKRFEVNNISLKIDSKQLKTTIKVPNISANNIGGKSGAKLNDMGKKIAKEVLNSLKRALKKQGIKAGKNKIEQELRRKIEQKLGIGNGIDSKKLQDKAKNLFKGLGF